MRENRETQPLPERPNRVAGRKGNPKGQALYERWPGVERLHSTCEVPEQRPGNLGAEGMEGRRLAKEIRRQGPDLDAKPEYSGALHCQRNAPIELGWRRYHPRWEPCALGARARVCAGGAQ